MAVFGFSFCPIMTRVQILELVVAPCYWYQMKALDLYFHSPCSASLFVSNKMGKMAKNTVFYPKIEKMVYAVKGPRMVSGANFGHNMKGFYMQMHSQCPV